MFPAPGLVSQWDLQLYGHCAAILRYRRRAFGVRQLLVPPTLRTHISEGYAIVWPLSCDPFGIYV
jgi:hypothetical protein